MVDKIKEWQNKIKEINKELEEIEAERQPLLKRRRNFYRYIDIYKKRQKD